MAHLSKSLVFAGIKGHVVALDRLSGGEIWRAKLKSTGFVNLSTDGRALYAATAGEVYCLDPVTGAILWTNPMKRLGLGLVSLLAGSGDNGMVLGAAAAQARQAAAAG